MPKCYQSIRRIEQAQSEARPRCRRLRQFARLGPGLMIAIAVPLALAFGLGIAGSALAARSDWSPADQSQMRLLLAARGGRQAGGRHRDADRARLVHLLAQSGRGRHSAASSTFPPPTMSPPWRCSTRPRSGMTTAPAFRSSIATRSCSRSSSTPRDPASRSCCASNAGFGVCSDICIPTQRGVGGGGFRRPARSAHRRRRLALFQSRVPVAPKPGHFDIETT